MKKNILIAFFLIFSLFASNSFAADVVVEQKQEKAPYHSKTMGELVDSFYATTGIKALFQPQEGVKDAKGKDMTLFAQGAGRILMIFICFLLFYLAIKKGFEPLLLIPIGFGGLLANIPIANMAGPDGMLGIIYNMGITNQFFPLQALPLLLIFAFIAQLRIPD
jgi:oxaloacetate decarboxylase beta subunit